MEKRKRESFCLQEKYTEREGSPDDIEKRPEKESLCLRKTASIRFCKKNKKTLLLCAMVYGSPAVGRS